MKELEDLLPEEQVDKVKAKVKVDSNRKMVKDKGTLEEDKAEEVEPIQVDETKVTEEEDELVERGKEVVKLNKSNRKLQKASSIIILKI